MLVDKTPEKTTRENKMPAIFLVQGGENASLIKTLKLYFYLYGDSQNSQNFTHSNNNTYIRELCKHPTCEILHTGILLNTET